MASELVESYGNVKIMKGAAGELPMYLVIEPEFTKKEKNILKDPRLLMKDYKSIAENLKDFRLPEEKEDYIRDQIKKQITDKGVSDENLEYLVSKIMDDIFLGYGKLGPLMRDDQLEEIMINGIETNVFIVHRKHGMCVTNMRFEDHRSLNEIIGWIANYAGREVNEKRPLLDAPMPDGSRANVAIPPAAPYGPSITIRKFKKTPYNIIELIELGTLSTDLAAFLWLCIEGMGVNPIDLLISGGAGSGKTTLLNALAMFIPYTERIVTVEDTLELNLDFIENWVPLEATPSVFEEQHLGMHMLLKNALRMRPDRVVVGEVRGSEAETLLVAMDIGLRGSMGTIHANNARETTIRLMDEPMNVPPMMLPLIDIVIVTNIIHDRNRGTIRRITEVSEISGIEKEVVQMGEIYTWDINMDKVVRTEYPIILLDKMAKTCGLTRRRLNTELLIRQKVIEYMLKNNIKDNKRIFEILQKYNVDPALIVSEIKGDNKGEA